MPGNAGVLWVAVRPSLEGFGADLRRQIEESVPPEIRVRIRPDSDPGQDGDRLAGEFAAAFRARLAASMRSLPDIEIRADSSDADRALAEIRARMAELRDKQIGVDISAADALAQLRTLQADLTRLGADSPDIRVRADTAAAAAEIARLRAQLDELGNGGDSAGGRFAREFSERLRAGLANLPDVRIDADSSPADRALAEVRARMAALSELRIGVDIDAAEAQARIRQLEEELDRLASKSPDVRVRVDAAAAAAELAALRAELDKLDGKVASPKVDTSDATGNLNLLLTAGLALGPALIPIGAAIAAGLASIGPAALVAAGGMASIGLAFSGVGAAIKAADAAQQASASNAGKSAAQEAGAASQIASAKDQITSAERGLTQARAQAADGAISAAERVTNAEQQIQDADRNAAQGAEQAARRVQDAEQAAAKARTDAAYQAEQAARQVANAEQQVATAQESAAASVQSAINSQISAEQSLANAQRQEQTAQESLTQARKDAVQALRDLSFNVEDNALNQRAAQLQLEQAQANQKGLGSGATQLQRDQAQLAVDQAQQRIKELSAQGQDLTAQKATADKNGVEGSTQVKSAQQQVTDSIQRTADAERALQQANANVTKAQQDGARQVAQAQQALADAREQQARSALSSQDAIQKADQAVADAQQAQANQRITSQEQIQKAEQSLADARRAQTMQQAQAANSIANAEQGVVSAQRALDSAQRSATQSAGGASAAASKYAEALKKLSPAGREFVAFYESTLKPKFDELAKAAQTGLLPGLEQGIKSVMPGFDQLKTFITNVSTAIGGLARDAGAALTQPFWHSFFDFMNQIAAPTMHDLGTAFGNLVTGAAGIMQALYQPVFVPILQWFKDLAARVKDFGTSAAAGTNSSFNAFLQYVKDNGPKVRDLLEAAAKAIGKLIDGLSGQGAGTLSLLTLLMQAIAGLPPAVLAGLYDAFTAIRLAILAKQGWDAAKGFIDGIREIDWTKFGNAFSTMWTNLSNLASSPYFKGGLYGALAIGATLVGLDLLGQKLHDLAGDKPDGKGGWIPNATPTTGQKFAQAGAQAADHTVSGAEGKQIVDAVSKGDLGSHETFDLQHSAVNSLNTQVNKWLSDNIGKPMEAFFAAFPAKVSKWWDDAIVKPTRDEIASLGRIAKTGLDQLGKFFADTWASIKKTATDTWTTITTFLSARWADIRKGVSDAWTAIGKFLSDRWNDSKKAVTDTWNNITKFLSDTWSNIRKAVTDAWTAIGKFLSDKWTELQKTATSIWTAITKFFADTWTNVSKAVTDAWTNIGKFLSGKWTEAKTTAATVWNAVAKFFTDLWAGMQKNITDTWNSITKFLSDTWNNISKTASNVWGGLKNIFKDGVNGVIDALNWLSGKVNVVLDVVHVPHIPTIPKLAAGGVLAGNEVQMLAAGGRVGSGFATNRPVAIVGEGNPAHPEYVIPTDPQHRDRAMDLYKSLGAQLMADGGILGGIGDWIGNAAQTVWGGITGAASSVGNAMGTVANWVGSGLTTIINQIKDAIRGMLPAGLFADAGVGIAGNILPAIGKMIADAFAAQQAAATAGGGATGPPASQSANVAAVQAVASGYGWGSGPQWDALVAVINRESGFRNTAQNPTSTAYGMFQFLDSTWGAYGATKTSDPHAQAVAGLKYISQRYGNPQGALAHENSVGWYANGAVVDSPRIVGVGEAGAEAILPLGNPQRMRELLRDSRVSQAVAAAGSPVGGGQFAAMTVSTARLESEMAGLRKDMKQRGVGGAVQVIDRSGDPTETARQAVLALRLRR